jgi:plasmid stabilization system protein ParE
MGFKYELFWSDEAAKNLESILGYIEKEWTQKEVEKFKKRLRQVLKLISINPNLFPKSQYNEQLHKAVLSKQTIVFYKTEENRIYLVYLFDTKRNPKDIK